MSRPSRVVSGDVFLLQPGSRTSDHRASPEKRKKKRRRLKFVPRHQHRRDCCTIFLYIIYLFFCLFPCGVEQSRTELRDSSSSPPKGRTQALRAAPCLLLRLLLLLLLLLFLLIVLVLFTLFPLLFLLSLQVDHRPKQV